MGDAPDDEKLRERLAGLASLDLDVEGTITELTLATKAHAANKTLPMRPELGVDLGGLPRITLGGALDPEVATRDLLEVGVIGEGGMGRVLLARQVSLAREVAVKTLKEDATPSDIAALVREARVAGALEHPSIVPVHALGVNRDGRPILVMKRVDGVSWRTLLADDAHPAWRTHVGAGRDRLEANVDVLIAVCRALELAHARGIVHRDVKPDNVMIGAFGEVYLVDWGIATASGSSDREDESLVGTPAYMAPEMVHGDVVDERTDVYLLGATLHRVLAGRTRHSRHDMIQTILAAVSSEPATYAASVPVPLAELCNAACSGERRNRPSSAAVFRERLSAFKRDRSALAICDVASERLRRLQQLLADANDGAPKDLARAYRLSTEARFGFAQSLEQFPEHHAAREGALRCIEALVDLELRQDHIDSAAALLEEAPEARPAFAARLEAARSESVERAREQDRLRALDRDADPAMGHRGRVVLFVVVFVLAVPYTILAWHPTTRDQLLSGKGLVVLAIGMLVAIAAAVFATRKETLGNAFSRRATAIFVVAVLGWLVNRVNALSHGSSVAATLTTDLLISGLLSGAGALMLTPRLGVLVPLHLGGLVLIDLDNGLAAYVFGLTMAITLAIFPWAYRRTSRTQK